MAKYTIKYNRDLCIGAATCVAFAPDNWSLDKENKAKVKKTIITEKELERNLEAAKSCPAQAIHIFDEKGKKIA